MTTTALPRFLALYGLLFAAFGVASPFFAAFLAERGLHPEAIGLVLAAGTAVRLLAGPAGGRLADRLQAPRSVLVAYLAAAACIAFGYLPTEGLPLLLLVSIAHAITLAPLTPIADALTLDAAGLGRRFEYGWVRGAGSAAFILGTLLSGQIVARSGLSAIIWLNGTLLGLAACCARALPDGLRRAAITTRERTEPLGALFKIPSFRRLMAVAALIQGSHALHDGFVVLHWRSLGIADGTIGILWSESVASEVIVFLFLGRWLLAKLGPAGACMLAAAGGVVRWILLAETTSVAASALAEPLHGLTFALQHLACMRLIGAVVPPGLTATAQAFYGTVAVGVASAVLTLGSGPLYARWGAGGFWVMSALCALAMPVAWGLRRNAEA
ncbi:MFS transporter [Acidisphaera sp. S103]|uniref:MFS transporter n=1 Tax=Acidisphaera sp. S103 TaxID=1747223 RepID=UPI00131B76E0|nr:MFS transporter [Acidisphaera sp. S103]